MIRLPAEVARGVIGSMAWQFSADRLRIVWFRWCKEVDQDLDKGIPFGGKAVESYDKIKSRIAARERRRREQAKA